MNDVISSRCTDNRKYDPLQEFQINDVKLRKVKSTLILSATRQEVLLLMFYVF